MRVLVIDNYDSFVFNLVQYLGQLGVECEVRRNDEIDVAEVGRVGAAGVLLSPGPGTPGPRRHLPGRHPGVRRQAADLRRLPRPPGDRRGVRRDRRPGRPSCCTARPPRCATTAVGVLAGLPDPFTATRYHSLAVLPETLPDELEVTGWTESGVVMAMRHRTLPIEGVQFHPESVLTEGGHLMLANWLAACGYPEALERAPALAAEVDARRRAAFATT